MKKPVVLLFVTVVLFGIRPAFSATEDAAARKPVALRFDFEDGGPGFKAWTSNGTYIVNFAGISGEQAAAGTHAFKLDVTLQTASYVYWGLPVRAPVEGELRLAAAMRIGKETTGRAGVGFNFLYPPSVHSGCGAHVVEAMSTTGDRWVRREADLIPLARDGAASIARAYVALAEGDNLGREMDQIGLFLTGKSGDRIVVYVDDLRLDGSVPADYAREIETRWAPVPGRRQEAFAKVHAILDEIRADLDASAFQTPGAALLAERLRRQLPRWNETLNQVEKTKDLRPDALQQLQAEMAATTQTRRALHEAESLHLEFGNAMLYSLDNPTVNLKILPRDLLPPARVATDLRMTAARGEIESTSLIVQALKDLPGVTVAVSDLTQEAGAAILPSELVDVRVVKCWYQAGSAWTGIGQQRDKRVLVPELLVHDDALVRVDETTQKNAIRLSRPEGPVYWDPEDPETAQPSGSMILSVEKYPVRDARTLQPTDVPADTLKQYWFTLRVPDFTPPGMYTGTVAVAAGTEVLGTIPMCVRVLPFRLPNPRTFYDGKKDFTHSIYYRGKLDTGRYPQGTISSEYKSEEQLRAEFRDMTDHGIVNPTCYQPFEELATVLRLRDECGMKGLPLYSIGIGIGDPSSAATQTALDQKVRRMREITAPFGISEIYLYGLDEAKGDKLTSQRKAWERVHELGVKSFVAGYHGHFEKIGDLLDLQIQANEPLREDAEKWHSAGHRIFSYANPQTGPENPELFRRNFGLRLWLARYDGAMTYAYQHSFGNIYNDFDHATYREHVFSYPTVDGVIPTLAIEGYREGVDDVRYGTLLHFLIRQHDRADDPKADAAKQARTWLDALDPTRSLDAIRAEMIEHILKLHE